MKTIMSVLIAILFTLGLTSAALAQEEINTQEGTGNQEGTGIQQGTDTQEKTTAQEKTDKRLPIPLTMRDLSGKSKVELSLPMLPADSYFGIAPMFSFQFALGNLSLGLSVPMAMYFPKKTGQIGDLGESESAFVLGNPTIDVLYRMCSQGEWSLCFGGGVGIGGGSDVYDLNQLSAHFIGIAAHQDWRYHFPDSLAISPTLVAGITNGIFIGQAELGTTVIVPVRYTNQIATQVGLAFALGGGVKLNDVIIPLIEFRGFFPFTETPFVGLDNKDPYLWVNIGVRLQFANFSPMFRLSVPLNDKSKI